MAITHTSQQLLTESTALHILDVDYEDVECAGTQHYDVINSVANAELHMHAADRHGRETQTSTDGKKAMVRRNGPQKGT